MPSTIYILNLFKCEMMSAGGVMVTLMVMLLEVNHRILLAHFETWHLYLYLCRLRATP